VKEIRSDAINTYFEYVKSQYCYDTTSLEYTILKNLYLNDSTKLELIKNNLSDEIKDNYTNSNLIKFQNLIKETKADTIFLFLIDESMLDRGFKDYISINKYQDSIQLNYVTYLPKSNSSSEIIIDNYIKNVNMNDWNEFKRKIFESDFWALKEDNGYYGCDGSTITIYAKVKFGNKHIGYEEKTHKIVRWNPYKYTIYNSYDLLLKLLGDRKQVTYKYLSDNYFKKCK